MLVTSDLICSDKPLIEICPMFVAMFHKEQSGYFYVVTIDLI